MSSSSVEFRLPGPFADLVNGRDLPDKVGQTISLVSIDDAGWPRLALLSIGEVFSATGTDVKLGLHAGSGTTAALTASGRALLNTVLDGVNYRIRIEVTRCERDPAPLAYFTGAVVAVDQDTVAYAELTSGITYRLNDEEAVVARWQRQLDELRGLDA